MGRLVRQDGSTGGRLVKERFRAWVGESWFAQRDRTFLRFLFVALVVATILVFVLGVVK